MRALFIPIALASSLAPAQTFRMLAPFEGGSFCEAIRISHNGLHIAGACRLDGGDFRAVVWNAQRDPVLLPQFGVRNEYARAASDDGRIIVGLAASGVTLWTPEGPRLAGEGIPWHMDGAGAIVVGQRDLGRLRGFACFLPGSFVELPPAAGDTWSTARSINQAGTLIVGGTGNRACMWNSTGGPPAVLASPGHAHAFDLSEDGTVVVGYSQTDSMNAAVQWRNGVYQVVLPNTDRATFQAVSGDGTVVVGSAATYSGALIWDAAHGPRSLHAMMANAGYEMSNLDLEWANDISSDGRRIVGRGHRIDNNDRFGWEIVLENDCPADFSGDFVLDFFDYLDFVARYDAEDPRADFNGDHTVDAFDYLDFAAAFDAGCE